MTCWARSRCVLAIFFSQVYSSVYIVKRITQGKNIRCAVLSLILTTRRCDDLEICLYTRTTQAFAGCYLRNRCMSQSLFSGTLVQTPRFWACRVQIWPLKCDQTNNSMGFSIKPSQNMSCRLVNSSGWYWFIGIHITGKFERFANSFKSSKGIFYSVYCCGFIFVNQFILLV